MNAARTAKPPERLARLQKQFAGHLRNPAENAPPGDIEERRLAVYRELFYNNINGFLSKNFPVLRKLYSTENWHRMVRDFYSCHKARTPLFPEFPREFLRYLQDVRTAQPEDPPFLLELAHYEWTELALYMDEREIDAVASDPDGDLLSGIPVLSPVAWPLSYQYPVHRIHPDYQPQAVPEQATQLLVYRDRADNVRFMELNPVSARLIQLLKASPQMTGLECLEQIATELKHPDPNVVIEGGRLQLEDFRKRDVIAGTRN